MASPQLENGYTRIANELMEALYSIRLKGREWDFIMCVIRASYGWSRKDAPISVGEVSRRITMDYEHAKRMGRELVARGILKKVGENIAIVKNYERWRGATHGPAGATDGPGGHIGSPTGTTDGPEVGPGLAPDMGLNPASPKVPRVRKESTKTSTKESSSKIASLALSQYLLKLPSEGQEVLQQTVKSIASTRKSGKVSPSVLDALAGKVNGYPVQAVLSACRIYLAKNYAGEGKREPYLLGIVRGEAKRMKSNGQELSGPVVGQDGASHAPHAATPKTQGQLLIDRTLAVMRAEQEQSR